jgi:hypothetical protein
MEAAVIEKEAMQLTDIERALLADRLLESLSTTSSKIREGWIREVEDRMQGFREGKIMSVDGPEALEELRSRFSR